MNRTRYTHSQIPVAESTGLVWLLSGRWREISNQNTCRPKFCTIIRGCISCGLNPLKVAPRIKKPEKYPKTSVGNNMPTEKSTQCNEFSFTRSRCISGAAETETRSSCGFSKILINLSRIGHKSPSKVGRGMHIAVMSLRIVSYSSSSHAEAEKSANRPILPTYFFPFFLSLPS